MSKHNQQQRRWFWDGIAVHVNGSLGNKTETGGRLLDDIEAIERLCDAADGVARQVRPDLRSEADDLRIIEQIAIRKLG
jgi:hypothetical protein